MSGEIYTTIVGNLADDPELRHTTNGVPVCQMRVANTPRTFDRTTEKWVDAEPTWVRVVSWRNLAQNVADSLRKGERVIAYGKLENREYENKEGEKRYSLEMQAEAIGPDLTWVTAPTAKGVHDGAKDKKKAERREDPFDSAQPAQAAAPAATQSAEPPSNDW